MHTSGSVAAVDLGATSGRVIVGHVDTDNVQMKHVTRFPNGPVRIWEGDRSALHWDLVGLYRQAMLGLRQAFRDEPGIVSVGIDSWAVDYGILRNGALTHAPYHYRDDRTRGAVKAIQERAGRDALYATNGLQHLPFNTLFQLVADQRAGLLSPGDQALLVPDLLGYWLTGERVAERSNASTTGLLDASTGQWASDLRWSIGLPPGLLPDLRSAGDVLGPLLPEVRDELGVNGDVPVTLVGSHDTASAVAAIPATSPDFAYISSGTWSLVGVELDAPILSDQAREANCTNEGGVDGRIRFLKNVSGMWLLSESVRTWKREDDHVSLHGLLAAAADVTAAPAIFDVSDDVFTAPGDMPARIAAWFGDRGIAAPRTRAEITRSILESLAAAYADTIDTIRGITGKTIDVIHIVGGGSQNELLCQLTANHTGVPVIAGPVEATALGNVLVQARSTGLGGLRGASLEALRHHVATATTLTRYIPHASAHAGSQTRLSRSHA